MQSESEVDQVDQELPTIKVDNLSITYKASMEHRPTLKTAVLSLGRSRKEYREIKALDDVSFELHRGSVLGIVGNNGAGKTTLIRTLAGILPPTKGRVEVRGKCSTLLALGVGFNPALSGRDNVMLGGLANGFTREEVLARYDEIADWTELGDFMEMPMSSYSSGMFSRLAFSVAVHMDPDILLVDEALSTGDARFKAKAAAKMNELLGKAHTMVLVSHALATVEEMCTDAIWLDHGKLIDRGKPADIAAAYTEANSVNRAAATTREDV